MNNNKSNVIWGVVLIAIGLIVTLNQLDVIDINFAGWWTLIIIIPFLISMTKEGINIANSIGVLIGVLLLLAAQNLIYWDTMYKLVLPLILVIIGIGMIVNANRTKSINNNHNIQNTNLNEYCSAFDGKTVEITDNFNGANIDAIFGEVDLDLKNAIFDKDTVIKASAIFGGIKLKLPENVKVKVNSVPIFGGISNHHKQIVLSDTLNNTMYTIYLNALCMFGGIDIE